MAGELQPLDLQFPIVDAQGRPTQYFIRWAQQRQIDIGDSITLTDLQAFLTAHKLIAGNGIGLAPDGDLNDSPTITAKVQEILDQISAVRGTVLYRGVGGWAGLAPDTAGKVLSTNGAGADPSWITPAAGGAGALTKIAQVITAASQANVIFLAIAATYDDLIVQINGRADKAAASFDDFRMQINADTGANYDTEANEANGAGTSGQQFLAQTAFNLGWLPAVTAPANVSGSIEITVPNYKRTIFQKTIAFRTALNLSNAAGGLFVRHGGGWWRNTAAIVSLKVFPLASNFVDGSVVTLYGRG